MYIVAAAGFEQELYTFTEPSGLTQQMETICVVMIGDLGRAIVLKSHWQEGSVNCTNYIECAVYVFFNMFSTYHCKSIWFTTIVRLSL